MKTTDKNWQDFMKQIYYVQEFLLSPIPAVWHKHKPVLLLSVTSKPYNQFVTYNFDIDLKSSDHYIHYRPKIYNYEATVTVVGFHLNYQNI
jgi:hypothetical protein